jgi:hypothetical protein
MPRTWIDAGQLHPLMRRLWRVLLLGLVLAITAPTVSRWQMAESGADAWVEVCTSAGMRWVSADADGDPASAPMSMDACDMCSMANERFAALAFVLTGVPHSLATEVWVDLFHPTPPVVLPPHAHARGPPAFA